MSRKINLIVIILATVLAVTGCRSSKETTGAGASYQDMSLHERFDALASSYSEWNDLYIPVKLELTSPKRFSVSGRATMVRNKSILISLRVFGMEVGSLYVTGDSVFAAEKIHKYYIAESLDKVLAGMPVTINDVQDMLLGRAFLLGSGTLSSGDYGKTSLASESGIWTITPKKQLSGVSYTFGISDESNAVTSLTASRDNAVLPVSCRYSSPVAETGAGTIARETSVSGTLGKHGIAATLRWSVDEAKWNTGDVRQWQTPTNYNRIPASSLLKMLESL